MDLTAIGIVLGLLGAGVFCVAYYLKLRLFNLVTTVLVFLAFFAIPRGVALIKASLAGDVSVLPSTWREYVAVAGVVVFGLSFRFLLTSFRKIWLRSSDLNENADKKDASDPDENNL